MSPRERVNLSINHRQPDRIPLDLGGTACSMTKAAYLKLKRYLKLDERKNEEIGPAFVVMKFDERIMSKLEIDFRRVYLRFPKGSHFMLDDETLVDEWGIKKRINGSYAQIIEHPLKDASLDDIKRFSLPNPFDEGRIVGLKDEIEHLYFKTNYALTARKPCDGPFLTCCYLRGYERFMMDLMMDKKTAHYLLGKVTEVIAAMYDILLDVVGKYVQIVEFSDDYATQLDLLISPALYREMIKPYVKKIINVIKSKTHAKILHHCCGAIYKLIPDFLELGINILDPLQPLARGMNFERLKEEFGDKMIFHGGIDTQRLLPQGNPLEVERNVRKTVQVLGRDGGYILAPSHNIQEDTPPENVITMFKAAKSIVLE